MNEEAIAKQKEELEQQRKSLAEEFKSKAVAMEKTS